MSVLEAEALVQGLLSSLDITQTALQKYSPVSDVLDM
ncbi:hypothetical protein KIPB_013861, partial [Kipferlia bialata]|eukprot:g13861.t1